MQSTSGLRHEEKALSPRTRTAILLGVLIGTLVWAFGGWIATRLGASAIVASALTSGAMLLAFVCLSTWASRAEFVCSSEDGIVVMLPLQLMGVWEIPYGHVGRMIALWSPDDSTVFFMCMRPWWRIPHLLMTAPTSEIPEWAAHGVRVVGAEQAAVDEETGDEFFDRDRNPGSDDRSDDAFRDLPPC